MLDEQQVYRIDHFLGKEATQDLHVLRFANGTFAAYWGREHIESVQIDVPETLDINDRAEFYDATGAVLDMLVTHLFQLAAEVAMEPPASLGADGPAGRAGRGHRLLPAAGPGRGGARPVRRLPGRARGRSAVQSEYLRRRPALGRQRPLARRAVLPAHRQGMAASAQRVSLILRDPPGPRQRPAAPPAPTCSRFSLAGDGEIDLSLVAKRPGAGSSSTWRTRASRWPACKDADPLPAYVRLIDDVLLGDRSLFTRPDGLASVWKVAEPLLSRPPAVRTYPPGSWGPPQARDLIAPGRWLVGQ